MKYLIFSIVLIAVYVAMPFIILGIPDTASAEGLIMVAAQRSGTVLAALLLGLAGLLYRPNRFAGFAVVSLIAMYAIYQGSQLG